MSAVQHRLLQEHDPNDPDWIGWALGPADVAEWELYELLNRRASATVALEADERWAEQRSRDIQREIRHNATGSGMRHRRACTPVA